MVMAEVIELRYFTRGASAPEAQQPGHPATGILVRPSHLLSGLRDGCSPRDPPGTQR